MLSDRARGRFLVTAQFVLIFLIVAVPGRRLWASPGWLTLVAAILFGGGALLLAFAFAHLGPALTANPVPKSNAPLQV
ncbi:MAG TPA: hypothetical protein VMV52_10420, partial [Candidatus Nanopelagicaceae bacterium]|nr:hypothetical protein [Candidatus Nanopelagicaceae bacterium]